jgi:hypothetical protein
MWVEVPCSGCDGPGCEQCDGRGHFLLTECPMALIDQELQEVFPIADLFKEGIPPTVGGSLDQPKWFLNFCNQLAFEENKINAAKNEK